MQPLKPHQPRLHFPNSQAGFSLILLALVLLIGFGTLLVFALNGSQAGIERDKVTADALAKAKEALIGYAITYRDSHPNQVFGYLPLPDIGSTRNEFATEGDAAGNFSGNTKNLTVIGRLPWRKLGLPPLRDGQGECLWYAVSGSFQNATKADVLNWDSLGHFDTNSSNGTSSGTVSTTGVNYAQRPVAIIFSASAVLQGQNRQASTDVVSTCGGNYNARNYLDSFNADANINSIVNYFAGSTNNATGYAYNLVSASNGSQLSAADLSSPKNIVFGDVESNLVKIVNDRILTITADDIFRTIIRRSDFATQISDFLDDSDFRLQVELGHPETVAVSGVGTKGADNINCNNLSSVNNQNFCKNWKEMLLLTRLFPASQITVDGALTPLPRCRRVLIFGGQKTATQVRLTASDKSKPDKYLEAPNLLAFAVPNAASSNFSGSLNFAANNPSADLLRCLP